MSVVNATLAAMRFARYSSRAAALVVALAGCDEKTDAERKADEVVRRLESEIQRSVQREEPDKTVTNKMELRTGFLPDPYATLGYLNPERAAADLQEDCKGWVSKQPNEHVALKSPFAKLHFLSRSSAIDVGLVVQHPDGFYSCVDPQRDGVEISLRGIPGDYRIWISQDDRTKQKNEYRFGVSELDTDPAVLDSSTIDERSILNAAASSI